MKITVWNWAFINQFQDSIIISSVKKIGLINLHHMYSLGLIILYLNIILLFYALIWLFCTLILFIYILYLQCFPFLIN